jgi:hypothetical protein
MTNIADFYKIVLSLIDLFKDLATLEKDKLKAVTSNNLDALNTCLKNEQVLELKLKGLDKKREQIQVSLGYDNLKFREIIALLPEEEKKEGSRLYSMLQQATSDFHAINDSVKNALDVNLHLINKKLSNLGINPDIEQMPSGKNFRNRFA